MFIHVNIMIKLETLFASQFTKVTARAWDRPPVRPSSVGLSFLLNWKLEFLAATKQLYERFSLSVRPSVCLFVCPSHLFSCDQAALWMVQVVCPSVCLSVCPSHLFDYVTIIVSSWNFQELSPRTRVRSMQKIKVRGQRSMSQKSQPNLTVSGL